MDLDYSRRKTISDWLNRIERAKVNISEFFKAHNVPFSRSQYYIYKNRFANLGNKGLTDKRKFGGKRKLTKEAEMFLRGSIKQNPTICLKHLKQELLDECQCDMTLQGISLALERIFPENYLKRQRGRPPKRKVEQLNQMGGFELIVAIAYYLKYPQLVSEVIKNEILTFRRKKIFKDSEKNMDLIGRRGSGKFTKRYNTRKDIKINKYKSVSEKRSNVNWTSMNIFRDNLKTLKRKTMAILSLPVITLNGNVRSANSAFGQNLKHFCDFDYKQNTLDKYLKELKYLGISTRLLHELTRFWLNCWGQDAGESINVPLICYYIDGNTKALWSSSRVKKNKVTMLNRVMGCLEQVFIHDGLGNPIYFETYSGHGPVGEQILGMFDKIEDTIAKVPRSRTKVCRAIIMDAASNSVKTLRAFASQKKYHYITPLDDNQWTDGRIISIGKPQRYKYGKATLREVVYEMEDSNEKKYLISSRAIEVKWDNGKTTILLTSLPKDLIGSSEVVRSYFRRWPAQELKFKEKKKVVSLHRVAGYGKKKITNEKIRDKQNKLKEKILKLKEELKEPIKEIGVYEKYISDLIPKRRKILEKCKIANGKRIVPKQLKEELEVYEGKICKYEVEIKKIENNFNKGFKSLKKSQKEWLRLQGKEIEYEVDVELDQIVTFHRVSLVNFYVYFLKHFLGGISISLVTLLHRIVHLQAKIKEDGKVREIMLIGNKKDPKMMRLLRKAIIKINGLEIVGPSGKKMQFSLSN